MFCPKCSQQQKSDEIRFCSGCGFELNVVKALLASENAAPNAEAPKIDRSLRRRDMTVGATRMFLAALVAAAITVDMPASHSARIILLIVAWLMLSLLINIKPIIQYFVRADNSTPAEDDFSVTKTISRFASSDKKSLPGARSVPAQDFVTPGFKTAEMVTPPSVTERTTNLLEKN